MDFGVGILHEGILLGVEYFPIDEVQDFNELNIYLLFCVLHFRVYN